MSTDHVRSPEEPLTDRGDQTQPVRWAAVPEPVIDGALAVLAFAVGATGFFGRSHGGRRPEESVLALLALLALAAGALLARRLTPIGVWALTSVLTVAAVLLGGTQEVLAAPMLVALYTLGRLVRLAIVVVGALLSGALYTLALAVAQVGWVDGHGDSRALPILALTGAAAAIGIAVRGQRDALEAARARARQAELTREEEAVRRVSDERVRIARELHDVLAHHISVINVQAGVARHLLDTNPEQARAALSAVRDAGMTVLTEMTAVLGLLRSADGPGPAEPAPGLHRLPMLLESLRSAGLTVAWQTHGQVHALPSIADLTAYRVIQEALTNAVKYGTGSAELLVHHLPQEVVIEVRNPIAGSPAESSPADAPEPVDGVWGGHGLIGMRERLVAIAGQLSVGPHGDGTWLVRAVIPRTLQDRRGTFERPVAR